ncbi:hypothetical protein EAG14_07060 [Acidovorax sp. 1608163]|nr:hypothetical protein EAG14_07060 [Acidovorax sp. 1608163]
MLQELLHLFLCYAAFDQTLKFSCSDVEAFYLVINDCCSSITLLLHGDFKFLFNLLLLGDNFFSTAHRVLLVLFYRLFQR